MDNTNTKQSEITIRDRSTESTLTGRDQSIEYYVDGHLIAAKSSALASVRTYSPRIGG